MLVYEYMLIIFPPIFSVFFNVFISCARIHFSFLFIISPFRSIHQNAVVHACCSPSSAIGLRGSTHQRYGTPAGASTVAVVLVVTTYASQSHPLITLHRSRNTPPGPVLYLRLAPVQSLIPGYDSQTADYGRHSAYLPLQ